MRDMEQCNTQSTVHENMQQQHLLQLATPELLAISQPPADFALPENRGKMQIVPALHEIQTLQRERVSVREQVCRPFIKHQPEPTDQGSIQVHPTLGVP